MLLSDEQKEKNKTLFFKKLSQIIGESTLEEDFGNLLENATFSNGTTDSLTGDGTLLNTILRKLTPIALKLNENILPESIRINPDTIIKICLLSHISKAVRLVQNDNDWEINKRGIYYKYNENNPSIKTGLHSLIIAQQSGIKFTPEEAEAMTINDRDLDDEQAKWYSSMLASLIRMANELVYQTEIELQKNKKVIEKQPTDE